MTVEKETDAAKRLLEELQRVPMNEWELKLYMALNDARDRGYRQATLNAEKRPPEIDTLPPSGSNFRLVDFDPARREILIALADALIDRGVDPASLDARIFDGDIVLMK